MDPRTNPFAPGAGSPPPELAGRDSVLELARVACDRAIKGRHARSFMLLGLRGTGKTVLLNEISRIAKDKSLLESEIEAQKGASLAQLLVPEMHKVLGRLSKTKAAKNIINLGLSVLLGFASDFKIKVPGVDIHIKPKRGLADRCDLQVDLPDLFNAIGLAAQAAGKGWILLMDEVQYLSEKDLSALIVSMHLISQHGLPVLFVGAGLPQVAKLAGDAKAYAERLFTYLGVEALDDKSAEQAIRVPIEDKGVTIPDDALDEIVQRTQGYPFFLQEWASIAWNHAKGAEISLEDVQQTYDETIATLDQGFFKMRIDRLTKAEIELVRTMAKLGDGPYLMADIAAAMERELSSLGPARADVIKKGIIYSTNHGYLGFTVSLFADYMRRQEPPN